MSKSNQRRQRIQVVVRDSGVTYHLIARNGKVEKLPDTMHMQCTPEVMTIQRALLRVVNKHIKGTDNQTIMLVNAGILAEARNAGT